MVVALLLLLDVISCWLNVENLFNQKAKLKQKDEEEKTSGVGGTGEKERRGKI